MSEELVVTEDEDIIQIGKVLSSETRFKIISLLKDKEMTISELSNAIGQTQANTSAQIKKIEKQGLMENRYEPGDHGVKKICKTKIKKIIIDL